MGTLPKVLVVDDALVVSALRRLLRSKFTIVPSTKEPDVQCLAAHANEYDVIVVDVDSSSDRELCNRLLVNEAIAERALLVTSASSPATETFLLRAGRPWLMKPFDVEDLERNLRLLVSARRPS